MARNSSIFRDDVQSPSRVKITCLGFFEHFKFLGREGVGNLRVIHEDVIDKDQPWDFFDGAASGDQLLCGGGGCLYITTSHFFLLKSGLGVGSNDYSEIMALKLLLLFVVEKECKILQVFGDSLLIINWVKMSHFSSCANF
jgi:hypothetical protein